MKEFLSQNNIDYTEYDVSSDAQARDRLVFELNSQSTPTVVVDDEVIIGFDRDRLATLIGL